MTDVSLVEIQPMRSRGFKRGTIMRIVLVLVLSLPAIACFYVAGMWSTGWWSEGLMWPFVGALWIPCVLAYLLCWMDSTNLRQAVVSSLIIGVIVSSALITAGIWLMKLWVEGMP